MIPWRPVLAFLAIAAGATTAIAILCAAKGWNVNSPEWALVVPIAMWAPAFARFVVRRTVDRGFISALTLRRWGVTGPWVILGPLALPLVVYGVAYAIAWSDAGCCPSRVTWWLGSRCFSGCARADRLGPRSLAAP